MAHRMFTRRIRRTIYDFVTCQFHTLVVSSANAGGPATFANAPKLQVGLIKAEVHVYMETFLKSLFSRKTFVKTFPRV